MPGSESSASGFAHVCLRVVDLERSLGFYEALGFEQRGRLVFDDAFNTYLGLPGEGALIELTVNVGREQPYELGTGYGHIALTVADLDATLAALAAEGIAPARAPFAPGGRAGLRIAFLEDPDGYAVELIDGGFDPPQDPPHSSQTTAHA